MWAYTQRAGAAQAGQTAPAGADLVDVDHRGEQGQAGHVAANHHAVGHQGLVVAHHTGLGGGAAHVKRDGVFYSQGLAQGLGADHPSGWARLHHAHTVLPRLGQSIQTTGGLHHQKLTGEIHLFQGAFDFAQVAVDARANVGIGHHCGGALVFAVFLGQVGGDGHKRIGQVLAQQLAHPPLVGGVAVGMQKQHGHTLNVFGLQAFNDGQHLGLDQFGMHLAAGQHALGHFKAQIALHQGGVFAVPQVERVGSVDAANFVDVAKATGGDQGGAGAAALEHGVDGHGGAMQEQMRLGQRHARLVHALQDALHQFVGGGEGLAQQQAAFALVKSSDVGEGAANVGGNAQSVCGFHAMAC